MSVELDFLKKWLEISSNLLENTPTVPDESLEQYLKDTRPVSVVYRNSLLNHLYELNQQFPVGSKEKEFINKLEIEPILKQYESYLNKRILRGDEPDDMNFDKDKVYSLTNHSKEEAHVFLSTELNNIKQSVMDIHQFKRLFKG